MDGTVSCVWEVGALLGEGPVWSPDEQALRFVDIAGGQVHRFDPATGTGESIATGGKPSFIVPAADGGWIVGSRHALHRLQAGRLGTVVAQIDQPAGNRTNDATVDARGRLWFGTMDDVEKNPSGTFWCLDRAMLSRAGGSAVVTNGPACSPDGAWIYLVDSPGRVIYRCPLGSEPRLGPGEPFIRLGKGEGYPDGVVCDAVGCLWVALWDGWGVRRYSPDGELLRHVALPCARVTKLAFGAADLTTAFVTTARVGLAADELRRQPLAGGLFAFDPGVSGFPLPAYLPQS